MGTQMTTALEGMPAIPSFIKAQVAKAASINEELKSGLNVGVPQPPKLGIKGKIFRIKKDGEETKLVRKTEDGDEEPISSLNIVILAANKGLHKLYYTKAYDDDADEAVAPDCYSFDGVTPSPMALHKQSVTCATCEKNIWGSKVTDQGKKTRACSDNKLLAVMALGGISKKLGPDNMFGQVFQLKVTPGALNRSKDDKKADPQHPYSWMEFVNLINEYPMGNGAVQQVPVRAVSVKLFFDTNAAYPQLRFKIQKWLTEEEYAYANERAGEGGEMPEDVLQCISEAIEASVPALPAPVAAAAPAKPALKPPADDELPDVAGAPAAVAAPAAAKPRGRKAAISPETGEPEAAAAPKTARDAKKKENAAPVSNEMDDELDAIAAQFS